MPSSSRRQHAHDSDDERRERRSSSKRQRVDVQELGLPEIGDDDFYVFSAEFRRWLLKERGKHLTELPAANAREYFAKFARHYNRGKLPQEYYAEPPGPSSRQEPSMPSTASRAVQGPSSRPPSSSVSDLQYRREQEEEAREAERAYQQALNKRDRREARDDERDQRATGKDRLAEKRAEARGSNKEMATRNEGAGLEASESFLMGGDDSFQARLAARDRAQGRREEQRRFDSEARQAELNERREAGRQKEDQTMAMFREMAAARFGAQK